MEDPVKVTIMSKYNWNEKADSGLFVRTLRHHNNLEYHRSDVADVFSGCRLTLTVMEEGESSSRSKSSCKTTKTLQAELR